ncbi:sensor histidine kinase [Marivirga salinae]|uniref:histidine kinase n=1 Tax=Marivirga salinarum TaxID=3059078 RepID=A0AA51N8C6_9BACT|nr:sensor histidine kinase [Marivirga sp. BDSF4-3]WMN10701.1 sensor histidine kinase [Marivirga sp. BDSF4-3]
MKRLLIFFLLFITISNSIFAQKSLEKLFEKAKELRKENKIDSSISIFKKIISSEAESQNISNLTGSSLNYLGLIYENRDNKENALKYYYKSIEVNQEVGNLLGLVSNYNNLANYYLADRKELALKYYQKAFDLLPNKNEGKRAGILSQNIGVLYSSKDFVRFNYDSAVYYYLNALKVSKAINDSSNISKLYHNLGLLYEENENLDAALSNYKSSLIIKKALQDKDGIATTLMGIGNIYLKQEKFKESYASYVKSLELSKSVGNPHREMNLYSNMVKAKMGVGAVDEASLLFQKYNNLRDSLYDNEKMEEIKDLETKYETERKEEEIRAQQIAIERENFQKNLFLSLSILLIILIISTIWFFIQKQKYLKRLKNEEITNMKAEQELKELNAMMHGQEEERNRIASDLHDKLGARLSSIKLLFQSSDKQIAAEKVMENINEAIKETREISHNLSTDLLSRFGLETAIKDTIRTINEAERINADLAIYGLQKRLPLEVERNIYHVILELINNTIKHAEANNINLQISQAENEISVFYEDDGIGFDVQNVVDSGMGMRSIYARVNTINGAVYFNSKPGGGINVVMSIPVITDYESEEPEGKQSKLA